MHFPQIKMRQGLLGGYGGRQGTWDSGTGALLSWWPLLRWAQLPLPPRSGRGFSAVTIVARTLKSGMKTSKWQQSKKKNRPLDRLVYNLVIFVSPSWIWLQGHLLSSVLPVSLRLGFHFLTSAWIMWKVCGFSKLRPKRRAIYTWGGTWIFWRPPLICCSCTVCFGTSTEL